MLLERRKTPSRPERVSLVDAPMPAVGQMHLICALARAERLGAVGEAAYREAFAGGAPLSDPGRITNTFGSFRHAEATRAIVEAETRDLKARIGDLASPQGKAGLARMLALPIAAALPPGEFAGWLELAQLLELR